MGLARTSQSSSLGLHLFGILRVLAHLHRKRTSRVNPCGTPACNCRRHLYHRLHLWPSAPPRQLRRRTDQAGHHCLWHLAHLDQLQRMTSQVARHHLWRQLHLGQPPQMTSQAGRHLNRRCRCSPRHPTNRCQCRQASHLRWLRRYLPRHHPRSECFHPQHQQDRLRQRCLCLLHHQLDRLQSLGAAFQLLIWRPQRLAPLSQRQAFPPPASGPQAAQIQS